MALLEQGAHESGFAVRDERTPAALDQQELDAVPEAWRVDPLCNCSWVVAKIRRLGEGSEP